jgi:hypothetical protein
MMRLTISEYEDEAELEPEDDEADDIEYEDEAELEPEDDEADDIEYEDEAELEPEDDEEEPEPVVQKKRKAKRKLVEALI